MVQTTKKPLPAYYISHGGGPWSFMHDEMRPTYRVLEKSLQQIPLQLEQKPKAILMISGHWEENEFSVMTNERPPMVYDYYGFPDYTYKISYPAPGMPSLAKRVKELLVNAGFPTQLNSIRGFDHGVYTPLAISYPDADVPVVQLSMKKNYDPTEHLAAGRALAPLRAEEVLIIGSGLSYHNLRMLSGAQAKKGSAEFDQWLVDTMTKSDFKERTKKLMNWLQAPSARLAHPREDHLIPLMVITGAAENEQAQLVYHELNFMGDLTVSSFRLGN